MFPEFYEFSRRCSRSSVVSRLCPRRSMFPELVFPRFCPRSSAFPELCIPEVLSPELCIFGAPYSRGSAPRALCFRIFVFLRFRPRSSVFPELCIPEALSRSSTFPGFCVPRALSVSGQRKFCVNYRSSSSVPEDPYTRTR